MLIFIFFFPKVDVAFQFLNQVKLSNLFAVSSAWIESTAQFTAGSYSRYVLDKAYGL